jgi:hypothetical protein
MVIWGGDGNGPKAIPGDYVVELKYNDSTYRQPFKVLKDPRSSATPEDYALYEKFVTGLRDKISVAHETIISIRDVRQQLTNYKTRVTDDALKKEITKIDSIITKIEEALYQTKNRSNQDPLNFPIRLTDKLSYVGGMLDNGEYPPTDQAYAVANELIAQIDNELERYDEVQDKLIPAFNQLVKDKEADVIIVRKVAKDAEKP